MYPNGAPPTAPPVYPQLNQNAPYPGAQPYAPGPYVTDAPQQYAVGAPQPPPAQGVPQTMVFVPLEERRDPNCCEVFCAIVIPCVGVAMYTNCGIQTLIALFLALFGWIPGLVYALFVIFSHHH